MAKTIRKRADEIIALTKESIMKACEQCCSCGGLCGEGPSTTKEVFLEIEEPAKPTSRSENKADASSDLWELPFEHQNPDKFVFEKPKATWMDPAPERMEYRKKDWPSSPHLKPPIDWLSVGFWGMVAVSVVAVFLDVYIWRP